MTGSDFSKPRSRLIKGVPVEEIIRQFMPGCGYGDIQRRYPQLTWVEIDETVKGPLYQFVQNRLAEGRKLSEIAKEMHCTASNVWGILRRRARNKNLERDWGGLSPRAAKMLRKLHYKNLREAIANPPTEERVLGAKGVGRCLFQEIGNAVPLKPSPCVSGGAPAPVPASPPQRPREAAVRSEDPPVYMTKAEHFEGAAQDPAAHPRTKETALFFQALIASAADMPIDDVLPSMVPCMAGPSRKWCLGIIEVCRKPSEVHWKCPECGKSGVMTLSEPETLH